MSKDMKKKGFTILELMVVCAIIGVLAAIVFVNLDRGKLRTRDAQRKADLTKIAGALESYRADRKVYPDSIVGGNVIFIPADPKLKTELVDRGYISILPTDPGNQPQYQYASDGNQYKLVAMSETISDADISQNKAQDKAGDFYNSVTGEESCFQISSSSTALAWTNSWCQ